MRGFDTICRVPRSRPLKLGAPNADLASMASLPEPSFDAPVEEETKLELLPALDEPDAPDEDEDDGPLEPAAEATQDPLKLYVRAIGDGRLLTPSEERGLARPQGEGGAAPQA